VPTRKKRIPIQGPGGEFASKTVQQDDNCPKAPKTPTRRLQSIRSKRNNGRNKTRPTGTKLSGLQQTPSLSSRKATPTYSMRLLCALTLKLTPSYSSTETVSSPQPCMLSKATAPLKLKDCEIGRTPSRHFMNSVPHTAFWRDQRSRCQPRMRQIPSSPNRRSRGRSRRLLSCARNWTLRLIWMILRRTGRCSTC
jgi:hypothetical protein